MRDDGAFQVIAAIYADRVGVHRPTVQYSGKRWGFQAINCRAAAGTPSNTLATPDSASRRRSSCPAPDRSLHAREDWLVR